MCSVFDGEEIAITCPVRFRQDWLIAEDAASFFFAPDTTWTSLTEVKLLDAEGGSAGNIDVVLVAYDAQGRVTDFGSLEVQAVYISGNVRKPFEAFIGSAEDYREQGYRAKDYPRVDYLSSSRKRLAPQLIYKGGILHQWGKKSAVALNSAFFKTLPPLPEVSLEQAEIAWFLYDLMEDKSSGRYRLQRNRVVYTRFDDALLSITRTRAGNIEQFVDKLQDKLEDKLSLSAPVTPLLGEIEDLM